MNYVNGAKPLSKTNAHFLKFLSIWSSETSFNQILIKIHKFFIKENTFEYVVCKMLATVPQLQNGTATVLLPGFAINW